MNSGTVHLIATDPPFNKNKDFHATPDSLTEGAKFTDRWSWKKDVHEEWVDGIKDDWPGVWKVIEAAMVASGDDMAAFLCWLGVRLMAMHRVLRNDGSIYLHCDPTANSYLRLLMDAIFGKRNLRNEVVWHYNSGARGNNFGKRHDVILWYSKSKSYTFNKDSVRTPYSPNINIPKSKQHYYHPDGKVMGDVWQMNIIAQNNKTERTGFPTQKPLALYERIIKASSNEGDIVLDPFAGCATTLVAAERLGRQWVGIDIWDGAKDAVLDRLEKEGLATPRGAGGLLAFGDVHYSTVPPVRTDDNEVAAPNLKLEIKQSVAPWKKMSHKQMSNVLADAQRSNDVRLVICAGCGRALEKEFMELDHISPKAEDGDNHIQNRILLCGPCNRNKGSKSTLKGLMEINIEDGWMENKDLAVAARKNAKKRAEWVEYNFDTDECKALMQDG